MRNDWWRGAVIYQIYPRSFKDSNGDGVGDLPGITSKLSYIAELGVDAIWISPFFRSPMKDFGYDVSDYRDVDPIFGTLADFDELISKAHALGLKVIIDQVLSHTSDQHAWFKTSRQSRDNSKSDWYVWADARSDGSPPNNWLSVFGGSAWRWDTRRCQYYLHSFLVEQADLNFHNPEVQEALLGEVRFWCERGVDGFRFDACNHHFHDQALRSNPPAVQQKVSTVRADNPYAMQMHWYDKSQPENLDFLERLREVLDEYGAASVGEVGDEDAAPIMADYTEEGKRLHMAYSFALTTADHSADYIRDEVKRLDRMLGLTRGWACWALSSHDVVRVASRWAPQPPMLWMTLLALLSGSICIYQGEELGLPQADVPFEKLQDPYGKTFWPEFKGRDGCRTPMPWMAEGVQGGFSEVDPWLPMASSHLPLAVDVQERQADSMLQFCKQILQWRRANKAILAQKTRWISVAQPLLGFVRDQERKSPLLTLFNLSDKPQSMSLSDAGMEALADSPVPAVYAAYVEKGTAFLPPYGILLSTVHV